ncbi:MAG: alanine racemase, partial [Sphingobacteriales bacterium]
MTLKSRTSTYRRIKAGEIVSYGGTWTAPKDAVIAVVPIGYADGYHRILSNKASVLFGEHRVRIIGNVCMDFLMIDVTEAVRGEDVANIGEREVVFFGESAKGTALAATELATLAQTISYEILTSVGSRVPRV